MGIAMDKNSYGVAGFFDVETTGLSPNTEEIVECCLITFSFDRSTGQILNIIDSYVGLNEPTKKIPSAAQRVHGITNDMVRGQRLDLNKLHEMMRPCEFFIAHNATFDKGFLSKLIVFPKQKKWFCSMKDIPWKDFGFEKRKLQYLLDEHNLKPQNHRADGDVIASLDLLSQKSIDGEYYLSYILDKIQTPNVNKVINYQQNFIGDSIYRNNGPEEVAATQSNYNFQVPMQQLQYQPQLEKRHFKRKSEMYIIWFLLGLFGGHRFYLRDYWMAFFMLITFGGYGIWWLIDVFVIGNRFDKKFG